MRRIAALLALVATLSPAAAFAEADDDASLAWQLRPVTTGDLARIDSAAAAFRDDNGNLDLAVVSTVTGRYQLSDAWAPTVRLGVVGNNAPGAAVDGGAFAGPLVGATYARVRGAYRLALFGGATLPVGTGLATTHAASITARPADRALFVDELSAVVGLDVAYVGGGLTAQAEATFVQTRPSIGVHVAYVVGWHVTVGADLHHDETLTASLGVRARIPLGDDAWIRPGIAVLRGIDAHVLDAPMVTDQTTAVMLDVPVTF